jgi:hypothetical protein
MESAERLRRTRWTKNVSLAVVSRVAPKADFYGLLSAAEKHAAFIKARGRHYSNEAEAMKVHSKLRSSFSILSPARLQ